MSGDTVLWICLAILIVVYVLVRRLAGQPISERRLFLMPGIAVLVGLFALANSAPGHVRAIDIQLLVLSALISIGLGAWRGLTVRVFVKNGNPWLQYTAGTVLLWIVQIAARFAVTVGGEGAGATLTSGTWSLLLTLGLSLAAESFVVGPRVMAARTPFSPHGSSRLLGGLSGGAYPSAPPDSTEIAKGTYPLTPPPNADPGYVSRRDARRLRREQRRQDRRR